MAYNTRSKQTGSIACPYCGADSGGSFGIVEQSDDAAPTKILYECGSCGMFYTAQRLSYWRSNKT